MKHSHCELRTPHQNFTFILLIGHFTEANEMRYGWPHQICLKPPERDELFGDDGKQQHSNNNCLIHISSQTVELKTMINFQHLPDWKQNAPVKLNEGM